MRGVILAGGLGTRLGDLTQVTNKHLLPVFNKPMIYYPIETLVKAGIRELMVIVSGPHSGAFLPLLKNGKQFGLNHIEYAYQDKPDGGIADALSLAEDFADGDNIAVILGDNTMDAGDRITQSFSSFKSGARIFLKEVSHPESFGVAYFKSHSDKIAAIVEKPEKNPPIKAFLPSAKAVIGLYLYDSQVFDLIRKTKPSSRGQLEITSINNFYLDKKQLSHEEIDCFWQDAGTYENLILANQYWYEKSKK